MSTNTKSRIEYIAFLSGDRQVEVYAHAHSTSLRMMLERSDAIQVEEDGRRRVVRR